MENDCLLCLKYSSRIFQTNYFFVIYDDFPLRLGHALIIPIRHVEDIVNLTREEFCSLHFVIQEMVKHMEVELRADGYNIGVNCGEAAGQTLSHLHIHLVPRHFGDVKDPRGGIRKFLPNPLTEYPSSQEWIIGRWRTAKNEKKQSGMLLNQNALPCASWNFKCNQSMVRDLLSLQEECGSVIAISSKREGPAATQWQLRS
jgi:diadenosine tetraphosphate (Ap4A) HIT family hydrolase